MGKRLTDKDFNQIESWIGTGPKTFNLLYSITRDGCEPDVFHKKCDNQGPTLTVMFNKEGSVYGGYISVNWETPKTYTYPSDNSAFLFQLFSSNVETPKKFPIKNGHAAIYNESNHGPIFGGDIRYDLRTFDNTIPPSSGEYTMTVSNESDFGFNYETRGTSLKEVNNGHSKVTELEIYAVKDSKRQMLDLPIPWRKTAEWGPKLFESLKEEVKGIQPPAGLDVPYFNILLMGPLGSGKSSFCNLMASVFRGGISQQTGVGGSSETSTTTMFTVGDKVSLQLYDTRGIADTDTLGLLQCNYILEDNVPDFYEIPSASLISNDDADFQQRPTLSNKIHCVVFVLDGSTVGDIPTPVQHKLKWYRDLLNRKGIPQAVLVTQIDKICDKTAENVCNTFFSPNVQEVIEKVADLLKFPRNSIWPVKNNEEEVESDESVNILALLAVRQIMYLAEDYLENMNVNKRRRSQRLKTKQAKKAKCERYGSDTVTN